MALKIPLNPSKDLEFGRGQPKDSGIVGVGILTTIVSSGTPEEITRPFGFQQHIIDRLLAQRLRPGESNDAQIRWGKPSNFIVLQDEIPPKDQPSFTIDFGKEEPEETKRIQFDEQFRIEQKVRIENPNDPDQFVIVARVTQIDFLGPDGIIRQFNLTPPEVGTVVD